jgi:glycosyltransferase involved in cell wall biosynthesis
LGEGYFFHSIVFQALEACSHSFLCYINRLLRQEDDMKILFVHDRFGAFGGAESNALLTATELKRRGHELAVLHGPVTGRGEAPWRATFSQLFPLAPETNRVRVQAACADFQPDVIYVHKMSELEVLDQLGQSRIPVVRMVHDHDLYCMRSYKYFFWNRRICNRAASPFCLFGCGAFLARNRGRGWPFRWVSYFEKKKEIRLNQKFHRIIVATAYMREELLRNGFEQSRIRILPPATAFSEERIDSSFSDRNLIVFAGQLIRGKGVDILLESLARVETPFECVIIGEGNHKSYCQLLARKMGLEGKVRFTGFLPQDEIRAYYKECSLVVLSSIWPEPFGAVGLEGMRHGLPVVAFDAGGIREWLLDGQNGFLVPWRDRNRFAERVEELLADKSLARQMGEAGRKFVTQQYDVPTYIASLENLLGELVPESPSKAHV